MGVRQDMGMLAEWAIRLPFWSVGLGGRRIASMCMLCMPIQRKYVIEAVYRRGTVREGSLPGPIYSFP